LLDAARDIFENKKLGSAGERALLEEFQLGHEVSVLVLTNGQQYQVLPFGRDHKRLLDDDKGPNTGGMGVVAPIDLDPKLKAQICKEIIEPSLRGISERKFLFRGVLFIGLMLTPSGPQVLEYNVRFGDPETQAILPLLDGDWADVLRSIAQGDVPNLHWRKEATVCVVMAAQGYPDSAVKGVAIKALSNQSEVFDSGFFQILHAGTARAGDDFVTSGGRVLNVITRDSSREQALERAYRIVEKLAWPGAQWRRDIGRD
jgi:phosphoribosylamine--glycine ligase